MIPYYFLPDIFKYLESDEQRQLRLVSKEWNVFLLPFVFLRLSTEMQEGFSELLRKYSKFIRELHLCSLDADMINLLSSCKKTKRLFINLSTISPAAALQVGESFPYLSYLELYHADFAQVSLLSPLTRKVQTLYYCSEPYKNPEDFMTCYKDFDCPLVTHLIIHEKWGVAGHNFSHIKNIFPAVKIFDYTGPSSNGYIFDHFVYDVENMVFKEISYSHKSLPMFARLCFKDGIPLKTPLRSLGKEVTHTSQFYALRSVTLHGLLKVMPQFNCLDAIDVSTPSLNQEDFIKLLLNLKDIRSLSFDFGYQEFSPELCKETFKATTVFLEAIEPKLPKILEWLTSCFPNLEELGIFLLDLPANYYDSEKSVSEVTFEHWEKLVENHPNLTRIHLANDVSFRCQIETKYPHILVDNKLKARYYKNL